MWQKAVCSADGTGQQLREERDEQRIIAEMPFRLDLSTVDVDQITHGLKEVERNTGRQQDSQRDRLQGNPACRDQLIESADQRAGRLIDEQDTCERQDTAPQAEPAACRGGRSLQSTGKRVGQHRGEQQQQPISKMKIHIKGVTGKQQERPAVFVRHNIIQKKYNRQKYSKGYGIKQHRKVPFFWISYNGFIVLLLFESCKKQ